MSDDRSERIRRLEWELRAATYRRRLTEAQLGGIVFGAVVAFVILWAFGLKGGGVGLLVAAGCQIVCQAVAFHLASASLRGQG